jgi:hypothetical protein
MSACQLLCAHFVPKKRLEACACVQDAWESEFVRFKISTIRLSSCMLILLVNRMHSASQMPGMCVCVRPGRVGNSESAFEVGMIGFDSHMQIFAEYTVLLAGQDGLRHAHITI